MPGEGDDDTNYGYKRIIITSQCDCGEDTDLMFVIDGNTLKCANCDKELKIEKAILYGCPTCTKPRLKELDEIEKEVYRK